IARLQPRWNALAAIQEEWARQHPGEARANSAFKTAVFRPIGVIPHEFRDVVIRDRPSISPLRERREDFPRASFGSFGLILRRITNEDAVAARRGADALCVEGSQKLEGTNTV